MDLENSNLADDVEEHVDPNVYGLQNLLPCSSSSPNGGGPWSVWFLSPSVSDMELVDVENLHLANDEEDVSKLGGQLSEDFWSLVSFTSLPSEEDADQPSIWNADPDMTDQMTKVNTTL